MVTFKRIHPDVVMTKVEAESVLLHMTSGTYFGLDTMGTIIWEQLEQGAGFHEVVGHLMQEFGVEEQQVQQDVARFLSALKEKKLLEGD